MSFGVDSIAELILKVLMPQKRKNTAAQILGKYSRIPKGNRSKISISDGLRIHGAGVAFGRLGGLARARKLDAQARRAIAIKAVTARWALKERKNLPSLES